MCVISFTSRLGHNLISMFGHALFMILVCDKKNQQIFNSKAYLVLYNFYIGFSIVSIFEAEIFAKKREKEPNDLYNAIARLIEVSDGGYIQQLKNY